MQTHSNGQPDFKKARSMRELFTAKLKKQEYELDEGKLVHLDEISNDFNRARSIRDRLLVIPGKLAPMIFSQTDLRIVEVMLNDALCDALGDLSWRVVKF
jgi:hypothetical protein